MMETMLVAHTSVIRSVEKILMIIKHIKKQSAPFKSQCLLQCKSLLVRNWKCANARENISWKMTALIALMPVLLTAVTGTMETAHTFAIR